MTTKEVCVPLSLAAVEWLENQGLASGKKPQSIASDMIENAAYHSQFIDRPIQLSITERLRRFREYADKIPDRRGPAVDVDRERIYE